MTVPPVSGYTLAVCFATGLVTTLAAVTAGTLVVAGVRGAHHLVCKEHRP